MLTFWICVTVGSLVWNTVFMLLFFWWWRRAENRAAEWQRAYDLQWDMRLTVVEQLRVVEGELEALKKEGKREPA